MDCIFCKILDGTIPSYTVYEDDYVLAILDISQATKGHTIVISKKHYTNLFDVDEFEFSQISKVLPKIANAIKKAFNPIGMNLIMNSDQPLQSVMHLHIHLIPRYEDDDLNIEFVNHQEKTTTTQYKEVQNAILSQLK